MLGSGTKPGQLISGVSTGLLSRAAPYAAYGPALTPACDLLSLKRSSSSPDVSTFALVNNCRLAVVRASLCPSWVGAFWPLSVLEAASQWVVAFWVVS